MFEETHRLALSLVREGAVDGLRIDHPDGLADPAGYLERLRDARRRARLGREDPRPRRAAARLAGRGHGRLRVPQRRGGAVRRPGGRGAADRAVGRGLGRRAAVRRGRRRGQARAGARRTFTPEVERLRRLHDRPATSSRRWPRCPSTAPTSATASVAPEDAAVLREAGIEWLPEAPRRVRHALPADHAAGDGQGRRGHRLLPLRAPARAQRRRRRPEPLRHLGRGLPRGQPRARRALPAQPAGDPDPRHQALGRRARAHRGARRHGRGVGGARADLALAARGRPRARTARSATSSSRRSWAPGRSSPSGSRPTWRRRCARPSAPRTGSSPTRRTRRRSRRSAARCTSTRRSSPTSSRSRTRSRGRASARRSASCCSS